MLKEKFLPSGRYQFIPFLRTKVKRVKRKIAFKPHHKYNYYKLCLRAIKHKTLEEIGRWEGGWSGGCSGPKIFKDYNGYLQHEFRSSAVSENRI